MRKLNNQPSRPQRARRIGFESLEDRAVPSVTIQFDYSFDDGVNGFFSDPRRRAVLQEAANAVASQLDGNVIRDLNQFTFDRADGYGYVNDPDHATTPLIPNVSGIIPANTLVIYVGGRPQRDNSLAVGGPGTFSPPPGGGLSVNPRPWGGAISFNTLTNWSFDLNQAPAITQSDFYSVAMHEITHVLGIGIKSLDGQTTSWGNLLSNGTFTGPAAEHGTAARCP